MDDHELEIFSALMSKYFKVTGGIQEASTSMTVSADTSPTKEDESRANGGPHVAPLPPTAMLVGGGGACKPSSLKAQTCTKYGGGRDDSLRGKGGGGLPKESEEDLPEGELPINTRTGPEMEDPMSDLSVMRTGTQSSARKGR